MTPTPSDLGGALERLAAARAGLVARPWEGIAGVLGAVGARFLDAADALRIAALERLPEEAGLSPRMAEVVLDGMAHDWTAERLRRLVREEFVEPRCLDGPVRIPTPVAPEASDAPAGAMREGRELMALGPSLCVQIVSGSVPGVGVNALVRSLLVKGPTLVKPGRGDVVLTELFRQGLAEADDSLAGALEVASWPGDNEALTGNAVRAADVVTVYGSDATVEAVRSLTPATTRVVEYHHREGVAIVGREALEDGRAPGVATRVARAVALFEQRGCVCPHVVYVERGAPLTPAAFAELLADALRVIERELPSVAPLPEEGAAIQQLRGTAELSAAAGAAAVHHGGSDASWTVVYEEEPARGAPVTLGRSVRVRPLADASELADVLEPVGRHLQSVAHAGLGGRIATIAAALGRVGASRVVPVDRVSFPPPWWLHDGRGPLRELVRWVEVER